jgi:hypothetical protein
MADRVAPADPQSGDLAMSLKPLAGFQHFTTHHCATGSLRHIYVFNGHPLSEEMLLGLGGGVSFSYWHFKGQTPFMGGRGGVRPPLLEDVTAHRTGVSARTQTTSSPRKAEQALLAMLQAGQPVMIQCDMGFLPYFDFGDIDYHFGWHVVVVCGLDREARQVLVADRDEALHPVSMERLALARGSKHQPFPPAHKWWAFDFSHKRLPTAAEVRQAIREQAQSMLAPPISNVGVRGIRKAAQAAPLWPGQMSEEELRTTLFNSFLFIDAAGGTGGGIFRYMFSRFLREAAEITADARLEQSADVFRQIGDCWQEVAALFREAWQAPDPAAALPQVTAPMLAIADLEEAAWADLRGLVQQSTNDG